jgi:hypothetical protein
LPLLPGTTDALSCEQVMLSLDDHKATFLHIRFCGMMWCTYSVPCCAANFCHADELEGQFPYVLLGHWELWRFVAR